jgi:hypothetical protein
MKGGQMGRRAAFEGLKEDLAPICRAVRLQGEGLDDLLDTLLEIVNSGEGWAYAMDLDGDAESVRIKTALRRVEMMESLERLKDLAASLDDALQGPIEELELPDLSDEEWQEIRREHLCLLDESNKACIRSHEAFKKWRKYYDAKVVPYRRKALEALR